MIDIYLARIDDLIAVSSENNVLPGKPVNGYEILALIVSIIGDGVK